jgi:hypothetical protein
MTDAPIQIRNPEVVRTIRALADRLGLTITEVVADAVRRRLELETAENEQARTERGRRALDVIARIDALPRRGELLTDDDLYDADGFPRPAPANARSGKTVRK